MADAPLIVHLTYTLDFGGLENLLVERINRMPAKKYRHAVVCLMHYTDFASKITKPGVELHALNKPPGAAPGTHLKLWKLLRHLRPVILHTYNLSAIEYGLTGWLAGVPVRVNGSHGREANDPDGRNARHNRLRRWMIPFYDLCYSNSPDLMHWNQTVIGVPRSKGRLLNNGIDIDHFKPAMQPIPLPGMENFPEGAIMIGSIGRLQEVKNHVLLIDAFARLLELLPALRPRLRLALVGDGPLLALIRKKVRDIELDGMVWLPGARYDIPAILSSFSIFALPSIAEGTPGSVLEAMASGLPVVATHVGGVPDIVLNQVTGLLVPPRDIEAMATALARYCTDPALVGRHGAAGRARVEQKYAMASMVAAYTGMYDDLCRNKLQGAYKPCAE